MTVAEPFPSRLWITRKLSEFLFGILSSRFVRNKGVPEMDVYRFAKYAEKSGITVRSETLTDGSAVCNAITTANNIIDEAEVDSENCILFITPTLFNGLLALDTL